MSLWKQRLNGDWAPWQEANGGEWKKVRNHEGSKQSERALMDVCVCVCVACVPSQMLRTSLREASKQSKQASADGCVCLCLCVCLLHVCPLSQLRRAIPVGEGEGEGGGALWVDGWLGKPTKLKPRFPTSFTTHAATGGRRGPVLKPRTHTCTHTHAQNLRASPAAARSQRRLTV